MRIAMLTGGSKGLGLCLCTCLEKLGYTVLEFSRSAPHAYSVAVDLAKPETIRGPIAQACARFSTSDVKEILVINNAAAIGPIGMTSQKDPGQVLENIHINYVSSILFITEMVAQFQSCPCRKVIVNISSGAALRPINGWSLYCANKAGLESYVRVLANEQKLTEHPFLAISVDPGVMDTSMQEQIRESAKADFPDVDYFIQRKDGGALQPPQVVAERIIQLAQLPTLQTGDRYKITT